MTAPVLAPERGGEQPPDPGQFRPVDLETLERLLAGLQAWEPPPRSPRDGDRGQDEPGGTIHWYPGYFTASLHAVELSSAPPLVFRGLRIRWAVCSAPATVIQVPEGKDRCEACQAILRKRGLFLENTSTPRKPAD